MGGIVGGGGGGGGASTVPNFEYVDTSLVYDCYYLFATNFRIIYANNQSHTGNLYANS